MLPLTTIDRAARLLIALRQRQMTIATAESCTGGLIAAALTAVAGSSDVVDCGFVTYSNAAKTRMLDVETALIDARGAVSREVALAMATGALARSGAGIAIAVTGIAGPGGGSAEKPVGLVHLAVAVAGRLHHEERRFGDIGRQAVRAATVEAAFDLIERALVPPLG